MKITNEFTVHTPIDQAWKLLTDLEAIAPCMPGAVLTGVEDDTYKGKVRIKVGPVISEFAGTARFLEKSDTDYRAAIDAKGRDARSAGNASAVVTAVLRPTGDSTTVSVDTDLKITGKLAQFGSGMIKEVSSKLLAQFVANLEAKLATDTAEPAPAQPTPLADSTLADSTPTDPAHVEPIRAEPVLAPADTDPAPADTPTPSTVTPAASAATSTQGEPGAAPSTAAAETVADTAVSPSPVSPAPTSPAPASPTRVSPTPVPSTSVNGVPAASSVKASTIISPQPAEEPEPLDLLSMAGSSVYKRLIPAAAVLVVIGAVIAWLLRRR